MKIVTVIGARPQFIKAAAVSREIVFQNGLASDKDQITEKIIHTGQHYDDDMSDVFFRELEIPEPAFHLGIGSGPHGVQTGQMLAAIEEVLITEKPDCVLIYGDTNSTLAGALAAAKLHITIAHIEAGLRSFNRLMPEEINRVIADHLSNILLCPSQAAVDNLAAEGIATPQNNHPLSQEQQVFIIGDVMADALLYAVRRAHSENDIRKKNGLQNKKYLLATIHRAENTDKQERLMNLLNALNALEETVVLPVHPRTKKILKDMKWQPGSHVKIIDPVGYFDMIALENAARMILTDSGGIQKEAYWLKVPCITLRDETEWVETVTNGWNKLTGADTKAIIDAVHCFNPPREQAKLYGDGEAAKLALQIIMREIERKN